MRKLNNEAIALMSVIAATSLIPVSARAADQTIDELEAAQQAAWNAHDAGSYAAAFDTDAEVVTAQGWRWTGQAEVARNLGDGFKLVYAHARLRVSDIKARALTPELASVVLSWSIDGARTIRGDAPAGAQHGYQMQVLQRQGQGWRILSQQDTEATAAPPAVSQPVSPSAEAPPEAFPTTPPPVRRCVLARGNGECLIYGKAKPAKPD